MGANLYMLHNLPKTDQWEVAAFVSGYTQGPEGDGDRLLRLTPEEVSGRLGVVLCRGVDLRGYAGAVPSVTEEGRFEIGPIVVPAAYREEASVPRKRLVSAVTNVVLRMGGQPYVFSNPADVDSFGRQGFRAAEPGEIPAIAFGTCLVRCPRYLDLASSEVCCSVPMVFAGPQPDNLLIAEWPQDRSIAIPHT